MAYSMYEATVPVLARALRSLRGVLQKGEQWAADKGVAPEVLLGTRLMPDMLPLSRQVQIATDMAKNAVGRLTGSALVPFADDETTFAQLYARIDRALGVVEGFSADQFAGAESRSVSLKTGGRDVTFQGAEYLAGFVLPNVFFHASIAYAILREAGVPLGKLDFLGAAQG